MNTSFNQGSARIYQFPVGGRSGLRSSVSEPRRDEITNATESASSRVAATGAWYHEAAIQESKPGRER